MYIYILIIIIINPVIVPIEQLDGSRFELRVKINFKSDRVFSIRSSMERVVEHLLGYVNIDVCHARVRSARKLSTIRSLENITRQSTSWSDHAISVCTAI